MDIEVHIYVRQSHPHLLNDQLYLLADMHQHCLIANTKSMPKLQPNSYQ